VDVLLNAAVCPRLHLKQEEYKCPCLWLGGTKCPQCHGLDKNCEICDCECEVRSIKELSDFTAISRANQARRLGLEDSGECTVHQSGGIFLRLIQNALQVST